jgi:hypothetical protein
MRKDSNFRLKNKNGVLVITGGGDGSPNQAISSANIIFRHINTKVIGNILSLKTNDLPAKDDFEALSKAKEIALQLNNLNKSI